MRLVQEKKYNAAFRNFDYLLRNTTPTPGLKNAVLGYLLENAGVLLAEHKTDHALAILEELTQRDRDFRSAEVGEKLSQAADTLISQGVDRGDFAQARAVMTRLDARYGAGRIATLATWRQRFTDQADGPETPGGTEDGGRRAAGSRTAESSHGGDLARSSGRSRPASGNPAALPDGDRGRGRDRRAPGCHQHRQLVGAENRSADAADSVGVQWRGTGRRASTCARLATTSRATIGAGSRWN